MISTRSIPGVLLLTASMLLASCLRAHLTAGSDWTGRWEGGIRLDLEWSAARIDFTASGSRILGRLDAPALGAIDTPIELRREAANGEQKVRLAFELPELGKIEIAATIEDGALRSVSGDDWNSAALQLLRPTLAQDLDECAGFYEIEPGTDVLVARGSAGGLRLFAGGSAATLIPTARDRFAIAFKDMEPGPPRTGARFARGESGAVERLELDDGTRSARRLRDHGPSLQSVSFHNGDIALEGLLLRPAGDSPAPAVVFIGGTGYSTADRLYEMTLAARLLDKGIAVLLADKRGCGRSGGDWRTSTLADLAGDATAAIAFLRGCSGIRADAIGLWGISEGGWVAPVAASQCADVAFIIDHGGPAVPPLEDKLDDLSRAIHSLGFSAEDLDVAMTLARALIDFYRSPEALPQFQAALEAAKARPWWEQFQSRIPQSEDDWRVRWWRKRGQLDSIATWKRLRTPALVLLGGKDDTMDLPKNVALFESLRASNPRLEIRLVPDADHGLRIDGKLVPGVVDTVATWILSAHRP